MHKACLLFLPLCLCFSPIHNPTYKLTDLMKARIFNAIVAPMLNECSYKEFRYELNKFGLKYKDTSCTVGHAVPSCKGGPDIGANLFAQFEQDNLKLGSKTVHKKELQYYCRTGPQFRAY